MPVEHGLLESDTCKGSLFKVESPKVLAFTATVTNFIADTDLPSFANGILIDAGLTPAKISAVDSGDVNVAFSDVVPECRGDAAATITRKEDWIAVMGACPATIEADNDAPNLRKSAKLDAPHVVANVVLLLELTRSR